MLACRHLISRSHARLRSFERSLPHRRDALRRLHLMGMAEKYEPFVLPLEQRSAAFQHNS